MYLRGHLLKTVTNSGSAYRTYAYDANGNANGDGMTKGISYNLLNLPQTVMQSGSTLATYTYDATGTKIRNTGSDGGWDYVDGIIYNNTTSSSGIKFIQTEAGRAIPVGSGTPTGTTSYHYEYNLTDNLGNVRITFDKNATSGLVEVRAVRRLCLRISYVCSLQLQ